MPMPTFLIIGAPKAGTTSLWDLLRQHPQINMSLEKEPRFFSHDDRYVLGWKWYESLFQPTDWTRAIGEASPHYSMVNTFPKAVERIKTHMNIVKIIYSVRDPYTALPSFWKQLCLGGKTIPGLKPQNFEDAIRDYPPMMDLVRYWHNLNAFRQFIPDNQIHLMFFEDFIKDAQSALDDCCRFLGVDSYVWDSPENVRNSAKGKIIRPKWIQFVAKSRFWEVLGRKCTPVRVRDKLKTIGRPLPDTIEWTDDLLGYVSVQLKEEMEEILSYGGKPHSYWKLAGFNHNTSSGDHI